MAKNQKPATRKKATDAKDEVIKNQTLQIAELNELNSHLKKQIEELSDANEELEEENETLRKGLEAFKNTSGGQEETKTEESGSAEASAVNVGSILTPHGDHEVFNSGYNVRVVSTEGDKVLAVNHDDPENHKDVVEINPADFRKIK